MKKRVITSAIAAMMIISCAAPTTAIADTGASGNDIQAQTASCISEAIRNEILDYANEAAETEETLLDVYEGDIRKFDFKDVADLTYELDGEWGKYAGPANCTFDDNWTLTYYAAQVHGLQRMPASYGLAFGDEFYALVEINEKEECYNVTTEYDDDAVRLCVPFSNCQTPQDKSTDMYLTLSSNGFIYTVSDIAMVGVLHDCIPQLSSLIDNAHRAEEEAELEKEKEIGPPLAWSDDCVAISDAIADMLASNLELNAERISNAYGRALQEHIDVRNIDIATLLNDAGFLPNGLTGIRGDRDTTYIDVDGYTITFTDGSQDEWGNYRPGRITLLKGAYETTAYSATVVPDCTNNAYSIRVYRNDGNCCETGTGKAVSAYSDQNYFVVHGITDSGLIDSNQLAVIATLLEFTTAE